MEEQIIKYETALLAKEKGFRRKTSYYYFNNKLNYWYIDNSSNSSEYYFDIDDTKDDYNDSHLVGNYQSAPTQYLLQKWLREIHNIHITVEYISNSNKYIYKVYKTDEDCINIELKVLSGIFIYTKYNTYEDALEEGLVEALNLIESDTVKINN